MVYNIGQKFVLKEDKEVEGCFGTKHILKKGSEMFVTADIERPQVIYMNGNIQFLPDDTEIKGYSVSGLSEWMYNYVYRRLPIRDMMEDYEVSKKEIIETIEEALEELNFYNHEGNQS
jgi:hypothetical protein